MQTRVLVVDDEQDFLDSVVRLLRMQGFKHLTPVSTSTSVPALLEEQGFDLVLLDITMPELDGLELLRLIKAKSPQTECIMITALDDVADVVRAMRLGAFDYLVKPIRPDQLTQALERALERRALIQTVRLRSSRPIRTKLSNPDAFEHIVSTDEGTIRLLHEAELHAASSIPILITGETGVGKELLARAVHACSRRARGPFVPVNMLALSPTLFESEFFGHVKGAFTGATRDKPGYLTQARGGTLFLDEIGDLSLEIQGKLLRILQEGEYNRVGATHSEQANVRFVAATNQDLDEQVEKKQFRRDLFYRLQFAHLHLPPLQDRAADIPALCERLIAKAERRCGGISQAALSELCGYPWPGNVRQLKGVLEAAINLADGGTIRPEHLRLWDAKRKKPGESAPVDIEPLGEVERRHIVAVYNKLGNNKTQAAKALQIGLQTLHRKLKAYGVS